MRRDQVWLTGARGQLGTALQQLFPSPETFEWLPTHRSEVDLSDMDAVRFFVREQRPRVVVNAAAYTAVDLAEQEVGMARLMNAELPRVLAEEVEKYGGSLVHVSTDYVFGGDSSRHTPYREEDETTPLGIYGQTKADGEETLSLLSHRYHILRTAWLYGPADWGKSFYRAIRERVLRDEALRVVTDEIGSPTSTLTLARVIVAVVEDILSRAGRIPFGLYHVADEGETTRHHFAETIGLLVSGHPYPVAQITHADLTSAARRPEYSTLSSTKMKKLLPDLFRTWEEALEEVVTHDRGSN